METTKKLRESLLNDEVMYEIIENMEKYFENQNRFQKFSDDNIRQWRYLNMIKILFDQNTDQYYVEDILKEMIYWPKDIVSIIDESF